VKVNQVEEASKFVKVGVDLQISNHIQIVKVEQVEEGSEFVQAKGDLQNKDLKDDVGIRVIKRIYSQKFKKYIYYYWIQKSI
jgi:hypothetical protein